MARLLADDFVLVTGSGKTYNKADLLQEARSGHMVYEHQEDTEQTVRVWGDTAVITAVLWRKRGQTRVSPSTKNGVVQRYLCSNAQGWRYVFGQSSLPLPKAGQ